GHNAPVMSGLTKELVVPEPHRRITEQLTGSHYEGGIPEHVVKAGHDPPMPQRMEQYRVGIGRLIGMKFVEKTIARMGGSCYLCQLLIELCNLPGVEQFDAADVTIFIKKINLLLCELVLFPLRRSRRPLYKI